MINDLLLIGRAALDAEDIMGAVLDYYHFDAKVGLCLPREDLQQFIHEWQTTYAPLVAAVQLITKASDILDDTALKLPSEVDIRAWLDAYNKDINEPQETS